MDDNKPRQPSRISSLVKQFENVTATDLQTNEESTSSEIVYPKKTAPKIPPRLTKAPPKPPPKPAHLALATATIPTVEEAKPETKPALPSRIITVEKPGKRLDSDIPPPTPPRPNSPVKLSMPQPPLPSRPTSAAPALPARTPTLPRDNATIPRETATIPTSYSWSKPQVDSRPTAIPFVQLTEDDPLLYPDTKFTHRKPPIAPNTVEFRPAKANPNAASFSSPLIAIGTIGGTQIINIVKNTVKFFEIPPNNGKPCKVTAVSFTQPHLPSKQDNLLVGTDKGDLYLFSVESGKIIDCRQALKPSIVTHVQVISGKIFAIWDSGTMTLWPAPFNISSSGQTMRTSPNRVLINVVEAPGQVCDLDIWTIAESNPMRSIDVYNPRNRNFFIKRIDVFSKIRNVGAISAMHTCRLDPTRVYTGHDDGKLIVWDANTLEPVKMIWATFFKIISITTTSKDQVWVSLATGRVQVFDLSLEPARRLKDWSFPPSFLSTSLRGGIQNAEALDVVSLGEIARVWDGWRIDDWVEDEMYHSRQDYMHITPVKCTVLSWNVTAQKPSDVAQFPDGLSVLSRWISESSVDPPDILVIGLQEIVDLENKSTQAKALLGGAKGLNRVDSTSTGSQQRNQLWHDALQRAVVEYGGRQAYSLINVTDMVGLYEAVYVRSDWKSRISMEATTIVKTGLGGIHGNKGAVVSRFLLDDTSFCFVNCHLAAQQNQVVQRNNDVTTIFKEAKFPGKGQNWRLGGNGEQVLDHQCTFFFGDLNYRLNGTRDDVISMIKMSEWEKLLKIDQLELGRKTVGWQANALKHWQEGNISFAPTFKYDIGTTQYDSSEKKRIPAWCDRILYNGSSIHQETYARHEIFASDHRPISGSFIIQVGKVDVERQAKTFNKVIKRGDVAFDKLRAEWQR